MGLFGFGKKKELDLPASPPLDTRDLETDLPSLDGSNIEANLPPLDASHFDGSSVQEFGKIQQPLSSGAQAQMDSKSISFNVPSLDFSLPSIDGEPLMNTQISSQTTKLAESLPALSQSDSNTNIDDELNKLFISDQDWKEPDWNNFEPYAPEEKIDEPTPEDFKGAELPAFEDDAATITTLANEPVAEPAEPFKDKLKADAKPLELFIRGSAYNRVFIELDQMNRGLNKIDSQVNTYEDMLKKEEPLLINAKDQTEYLYRKLNLLDKKIFAQ